MGIPSFSWVYHLSVGCTIFQLGVPSFSWVYHLSVGYTIFQLGIPSFPVWFIHCLRYLDFGSLHITVGSDQFVCIVENSATLPQGLYQKAKHRSEFGQNHHLRLSLLFGQAMAFNAVLAFFARSRNLYPPRLSMLSMAEEP